MNTAVVGGSYSAMQAVPYAQSVWDVLRLQISQFGDVVTIDGYLFQTLSGGDKRWISAQYMAIVAVPVIYVRDTQMFRTFLARVDLFPPGSILDVAPGNESVLMNPTAVAGALPPVDPPKGPNGPLHSAPAAGASVMKPIKISRPPNAFILYRKAHHQAVKAAHPGIHNNQISVILGTQWQREDPTIRAQYKTEAIKLKEEHMKKHPDYQYQPRKASEVKRRMSKKKAAALTQHRVQKVLGTPSSPDGHGFSEVDGEWAVDHSLVMPGLNTTALFDQVRVQNTQQELNRYLSISQPIVFSGSNQYLMSDATEEGERPWNALEAQDSADKDAFEEFIDPQIWAGFDTSS